ncbi:MAG: glycosyltransferase family 9 protein [Bryobacteraceae bacterium]
MSAKPHRRLLIRPGAIGDCILSFPSLEAAKGDDTEVWIPRPILPLIRFADRTRAIIDTGLDRLGVFPGARLEALERFDSIYSWYGAANDNFREAVRHLPFTFFPALPPPTKGVPRIPVPALPKEDHVVLQPFASGSRKTWPMDNFRAVAQALSEQGIVVKWTAGPEETLPDDLRESAVYFEDLYELGCWISSARLYIGNDSGISHLAAAVGTSTIAIFLATDPIVWAPRGEHVTVAERPSVEQVVAIAMNLMEPSK